MVCKVANCSKMILLMTIFWNPFCLCPAHIYYFAQYAHRMQRLGMTTYLYAPKDDSKHRMYWRDLYTVEEADHLTGLIQAAEEQGISFVYALSPGLDMTYSNSKEVACLKRKLEQVWYYI